MEKLVFEGYGCQIFNRKGRYFISYDSGESSGSRQIENEITSEELEQAMRSEQDAYDVILNAQRRDYQRR